MKKLVILGAIAAVASLALPSAPAEAKRRVCHVEKHCLNPHGFKLYSQNNEDGILYRWDLTNNTLSQNITLTTGIGQAYTPTLIGADGAVYAISNATLYSIRA